jgi:DNA helicase IV
VAAISERQNFDAILTLERAELRRSREYLNLMREDVLGLSAMGGDPVSEEYLKAELYHRAEALKDIPDTPLFFGRLDYSGSASEDEIAGHSFHIGRRHVHAPDGSPAVIDWRAPVSMPFYRASAGEPMGLDLRRRFGFAGGELTAYEDEGFGAGAVTHQTSRILIDEIERPRSGPMRDIVATIQPDQDDIVRAGPGDTVCVQGAPGTGKTAVGLHRVAYLLYAYKEQAHRRGVVVVGPNRAFLSYIRNVLPALGELNVKQVTVGELVSAGEAPRGTDAETAAVIKGSARMAQVLHRALWSALRPPAAPVMVPRGARRFRVPVFELDELVMELRVRGVRYGSGREMLEHRIAHVILSRMEEAGEACDDRTHESVRRSRPVKAAAEAMWPKVDANRLVFILLTDPAALAAAAAGILSAQEQEAILWSDVPRSPKSAKWSAADLVLIDEARDLLSRTPSLAHVVVDEAQDLSPMEVRAIGRRVTTGAATVLGDIAQGTTAWATTSWAAMLEHLGKPEAAVRELSVGYRVPRQILDYASALLPLIAPELSPASSLRTDPGALDITRVPAAELAAAVAAACAAALRGAGSVAVIAADPSVDALAAALSAAQVPFGEPGADARLTLVPVTMVKGLEFDHVIVVEPAGIVAAEARGLQRLYVALTRAVSQLTVLHSQDLPAVLLS